GLRVLIIADFLFDPLSRSLLFGLSRLGVQISILGVPGLIPNELPPEISATVTRELAHLPESVDVIVSIPVSPSRFEKDISIAQRERRHVFPTAHLRRLWHG